MLIKFKSFCSNEILVYVDREVGDIRDDDYFYGYYFDEVKSECSDDSFDTTDMNAVQVNFVDDTDVKYGTVTHKKGGDMYTSVRVSKGGGLQGVQKFKCGEWYKGIDTDPTRDGYNWVVCDPRFFNKPYYNLYA